MGGRRKGSLKAVGDEPGTATSKNEHHLREVVKKKKIVWGEKEEK